MDTEEITHRLKRLAKAHTGKQVDIEVTETRKMRFRAKTADGRTSHAKVTIDGGDDAFVLIEKVGKKLVEGLE